MADARRDGGARVIVQLKIEAEASSGSKTARKRKIDLATSRLLGALAQGSHREVKRYANLAQLALEVTPEGLAALLASPEVVSISKDRLHTPSLTDSVPLIDADAAAGAGFAGAGQAVAVLDTGVDASHPFLAPRVVSEACFSTSFSGASATSVCPSGGQSQIGSGAAAPCSAPGCDHGTHVAGIAAGNDADSTGVAPAANVIAIQVFSRIDDAASCGPQGAPCVLAFTSDILAGLDRVFQLRDTFDIAAVNLSLGGGAFTAACDGDDLKGAIDLLRDAGIATVAASGNSGLSSAIASPACISSAIAVGSTTKSDQVSGFSNASVLLELLAPGSSIRSSVPGGGFASLNGTSMAAPHAAGAIAALRSAVPGATVDQLVAALGNTGTPIVDGRNDLVLPRIDLDDAIAEVQAASAGAAMAVAPNSGFATQGNENGPFVPTSTGYRVSNPGSTSLDFSISAADGWLAADPASGTLPPGGSTTVTVFIGAAANALPPGSYETTLTFDSLSGDVGDTSRTVRLSVRPPLAENDKLQNAQLLISDAGSLNTSNIGATKESGEPNHANNPGGASLWWSWVAPSPGELTVDTFGSSFDTTLGMYLGDNVTSLFAVGSNDDAPGSGTLQSRIVVPVAPGQVYFIAVDGFNGSTGDITLSWQFDEDTSAIGSLSVTPNEGLLASGDFGGPITPEAKTYTVTNTGAADVTFDVIRNGNFFSTSIDQGVLQPGASTTLEVTLDSNSLQPGTSLGSVVINGISRTVSVTAQLAGGGNDAFDARLPVTAATEFGTNVGASKEVGEPNHAGNPGGASVWWSWVAPESGLAVIDTAGSNFDTLLAVYQGAAVDALVALAGNDDAESLQSSVVFNVTAGASYLIAVDGFNGDTGSITLNVGITADREPGDNFANRQPITGATTLASNRLATRESGEPAHAGNPGGRSVWWTWTAPASGTIAVDTFASTFDTLLAVYTGDTLGGLAEVASNDDAQVSGGSVLQSRVAFDALAGQTYQIAVDGWGGASGDIQLNLEGLGIGAGLAASVLPSSRSVRVGSPASAFAAIINTTPDLATGCSIAPITQVPGMFSFRSTDPATNLPTGDLNEPVTIPAGSVQTFVIELEPTQAFLATDLQLRFECDNAGPASVISGLNTLLLSASPVATADLVALAATLDATGIVEVDPDIGGVFAVATVNVGSAETITAVAVPSDPSLPLNVAICETDPATSLCIDPPAQIVTTPVLADATPTFGIFVQADGPVPFQPADARVFVVFLDAANNIRGSTSVAVRAP